MTELTKERLFLLDGLKVLTARTGSPTSNPDWFSVACNLRKKIIFFFGMDPRTVLAEDREEAARDTSEKASSIEQQQFKKVTLFRKL